TAESLTDFSSAPTSLASGSAAIYPPTRRGTNADQVLWWFTVIVVLQQPFFHTHFGSLFHRPPPQRDQCIVTGILKGVTCFTAGGESLLQCLMGGWGPRRPDASGDRSGFALVDTP